MQTIDLAYVPTEKQKKFHSATADEVLYGGAAGGGKSYALLMEALIRALEVPNYRALLLRRSFPELEASLILTSKEKFPRGIGEYKNNRRRWELFNGSMLEFGYIQSHDDVYQYHSAEYEYIGFDELSQFEERQYVYLSSRNRTTKRGVQPVMRAATNPGGRGHLWVKSRFVDPAKPYEMWETQQGLSRQYIPATVYDNPHIVDNDPGYIKKLEAMPEDDRRALLHGDWDAYAGQVFKEFDRNVHVIRPFQLPAMWTRYMGLDWGYSKPFAVLWGAVAPEGTIYIYREYYGCRKDKMDAGVEMDAREVAREVLVREDEIVNVRVADPSTWQRRGHDGVSISEIFAQEGVPFQKGDNDRLQGKMAIHDRLRIEEDEDGNKKPKMYIFENCTNLIRTLPALPYDNRKPEDVDTDSEDHLYDCLRYLLMARPIPMRKKRMTRRDPVNSFTAY